MKSARKNAPLVIGLVALLGVAFWWAMTPTSTPTPAVVTAETPQQTQSITNPAPVAKPVVATEVITPLGTDSHFCPVFTSGIARGAEDSGNIPEWAHGDVGTLQIFLATRYSLNKKGFVDGIFGSNTESYLKRYQKEVELPGNGIVDQTTRQKMLSPCMENAAVNGKAFPKRSISFNTGSFIVGIKLHEAIQAEGTIEQGAFRVELMSLDGVATIRVTGRAIDGIHTQVNTLKQGEKILTENWPVGLMIELQSLTTSDANFVISQQPTD